jgi:hypothetical protein
MTKAGLGRLSGTYSSIWPARRQARCGGFLIVCHHLAVCRSGNIDSVDCCDLPDNLLTVS